ncbi:MAG: class II glutamine amidotransferase [Myxococcales bacterium]|nr:class II glutamine amidotransferase [Myxococcales bacterium]
MSRLLAYIANDPQRVQCVLHPGRKLLVTEPAGPRPSDGWGIGFYQGGEVLLRRRPKPPDGPVDFYEVAADLRTDVLIGHVRSGTVGAAKNENTHPFRFRSWLFAHRGTINHFDRLQGDLLASVPDFLRRNIRGQTDSEHLFHLFLAFLHDAGKLDDVMIPPLEAARALSGALALVARLGAAAGASPSVLDVALTNGRILLCTRRGAPLHLYRVNGVHDCPVCREQSTGIEARTGRPRHTDHDHLRGVVMVADARGPVDPPWEEIPEGHVVAVSHELEVSITPLESATL